MIFPLVFLPKSTYNTIVTGAVAPSAHQHSTAVLAALAGTLLPGGGLSLTEPVLAASATAHPQVVSSGIAQTLGRSGADLVSALKISGFVEVTVSNQRKASEQEIAGLIQAWGVQTDVAALKDQIEFIEVRLAVLVAGVLKFSEMIGISFFFFFGGGAISY